MLLNPCTYDILLDYLKAYNRRLLNGWEALRSVRKPLIAAVNGYALGGGCELALMCDIIIASHTAALGQPEITLGVIPGMGGTQRLTRAVGKSRAMEMILTGARVSAGEAARIGLISRTVPAAELMDEVRQLASKIARYSGPAVAKAKECVNLAFEGSLSGTFRRMNTFYYYKYRYFIVLSWVAPCGVSGIVCLIRASQ